MTSHQFNWDVDTWTTLDSYYNQDKILTQHQLESFNNLVDYVIPQIIEKNNPVVIATDYSKDLKDFKKKCTIKFMQTYLSKPLIHENSDVIKPLYPNEARLRNLTYAAPMFIDVECTITDSSKAEKADAGKPEYERRIPFLKLPVMLHSKYCHLSDRTETGLTELGECEYDQGGYFIVNGGEKVLISQERVAENQVFVWTPPKTTTSKYTHEAEIKSSIDQRFYPVKTNKVKLTKEPTSNIIKDANKQGVTHGRTLHVQMPYIKDHIPLFIMFRALGVATEKEMFEMIMPDLETIGSNYLNFLIPSVDEARIATVIIGDNKEQVMTQQQALSYLAERLNITFTAEFKKQHTDAQIKYVKDILSRELFPHIGQMSPSIGHTFRKKAFFLGYMTRKLIDCYFGVRPYDDRDHYGNKRVDLAGPLITSLFRTHFIKLIRDIRKDILPKLTGGGEIDKNGVMLILRKTIQGCNIDSKIKYGLSTGNWSTQKTSLSTSKKGIAQVLNRMSFAGALSHTRRIQSPLERAGSKIVPPRRLHGTHFGMCCPNETPEGQQIGIVKNLAMQTHVTIQTSDYPIRIILNKLGVIDLIETVAIDVNHSTKIFVNGDWFGVISEDRTRQLYHRLKTLKRHGVIVPYISIAWFICWNEIHIQTDGGRYSRPLYVVEDGLIIEDGHISEESFVDDCQLLIEQQCQEVESFHQKFTHGELKWPQFLFGYHDGVFDVKTASIDNGGVIEYLDTNEIETSMIAMTRADMNSNRENNNYYVRYTHCEIHPMMMMGVVSAVIPFSDHNQSPRNCYQCLWKEEEVIMSDGTKKKIGEIRVGDYVITVDPETLEQKPAKVINQYVKTTEKKIVKVTTISGRTIICTEDHPILTCNGWKDAGKLTGQDLVCICSNLRSGQDNLIMNEINVLQRLQGNISVNIVNNSIFVPINKVEPHESVEIADITIDSETHSFITGQYICVHNSSMAKQSIGYYTTNYNSRMDTMAHVLVYAHKPLVSTRLAKYALMDKLPHGATAMLLYACYTGYNQEDSIVVNKDAVERGFFNTLFFRSYSDKAQKHKSVTTATERFAKPDKKTTRGIKVHGSYDAIDSEGRPIVGKIVKGNDVVIGKVIELKEKDPENFTNKDASTTTRPNEYGTIDKVITDIEGGVLPYNADGHRFIKARVSILRKPEIGDKFACFDDKTQVLTNVGWKFFKDLETSDQIACMENGKLIYAHPTDLQSYHVNDQMMYTVETQQINLKVTPNHRMYVKKRDSDKFIIDEAQNLFGQRLKFKKNCEYIPSNWCGDKFTFPETTRIRGNGNEKLDEYVINMDHWLTFFGIWIAEGWTTARSECNSGYVTISANKPRVKLALEKLEIDLGWHFIKCENSGKWKLSNVQIYQYLQPLSVGATNKYLPEWVWQLNQNQANLLLNSMCIGDGYNSKSNTQLYYTSSTKLANDFQRLALHAGLSANIRVRSEIGTPYEIKGHIGVTTATAYYITVIKSKNEPQINHGHISEKQDKWEQYTGQVYCCTVPSGIIYVRREGIPEWLGNSRYSQKGTTGILYRSIDMPFTCYGLVPDIIMNPHGIPSRMTVGKLLETLLGKVAVSSGQVQDATPFVSFDFEKFKETLRRYGMNELGNEVMYNGQTGEMFNTVFFYGPTYYQRLKHMVDDKVHCLSMDHEVLTSNGWKFFPQLTMDDKIATLKDGKLVYDKPIKLLSYPDYSGKMYHIKSQQIDLNVTTNHRMWVSRPYGREKEWQPYQLVTAEEINTKHVKYQKDAHWDQPDFQFVLPSVDQQSEKLVDMNAWLTFFGIWIAEGWTTTKGRVQICQCKERVRKVIFDAIEKLGYLKSHSNDDKITICDKQLYTYLSTYSVGAPNKYLPDWVWKLSQQQCQMLIYNMQLGDGTFKKSGGSCYYTSSIKLADDFMRLCLHAGFSSNKTKHLEAGHTTTYKERDITANHDMWRLSVITTKNRPAVNHGHHNSQQIQVEEISDFTGPVFCLQVPSEVFYVRRNGLPVWTGNSRESGPVQLLTRQPAEGRSREGGLRLGEMERDCLIAHGVPKFLKERMMDSSDLFKAYVSKKEETLIIGNPEQKIFKFNGQNIKDDEVMQIQLPYAMKLLLQELQSMGLDMRLHMS